MRAMGIVSAVLLGLTSSVSCEAVEASIGTAEMKPNGTIELSLVARGPNGIEGRGFLTYKRSDPDYRSVLRHLGGLHPGETKSVPPWPDPKP